MYDDHAVVITNAVGRLVIENHVVIAGWSARIPSLLTEFSKKDSCLDGPNNQPCSAFVVLAEKPKVDIEKLIKSAAIGGTRCIIRSGDPSKATDLVEK